MDLLLELGTEELPASAVYDGITEVYSALPALLGRARLGHVDVTVMGSPRRLTAIVTGVPGTASPEVLKKRGPSLAAARNPDGSWSEAAKGFARSQGIEPDTLTVEETDKGSYVMSVTEVEGGPAGDLLPPLLAALVESLHFRKSMRWGSRDERFSRPVRWLVALLDGEVLSFEYAGLTSGRVSQGHRYLSGGAVEISDPGSYQEALERASVIADNVRRRTAIETGSRRVCSEAGLEPVLHESVLDEVVMLVEWPGVVLGRFDERFLALPREVLEHAMEEHQRYFPVADPGGGLQAGFIAVHNGSRDHEDTIRKGHERVLTARLTDAEFFFREDLKRPLSDRVADLEHVVYQSELGSMAEKADRLSRVIEVASDELGVEPGERERAAHAARLSKCDLVTHMVVEFTALQGIMGSIYAEKTGEDPRVARAIAEQYLPRRLGDELPGTVEGSLLSLAEKADNLAASFGLGHVPTGSEDPYGLRRQALGFMLVTIEGGLLVSVTSLVRASAAALEEEAHGYSWSDEAGSRFAEFFQARERVFLTERGYRYDLVEAVMSVDWDRPLAAYRRLEALVKARESGLLARLYTGFERCHNLSRGAASVEVSEGALVEEAEKGLFAVLRHAEEAVGEAIAGLDFDSAVGALEPLCAPVDRLFDDVLIMAEDEGLRRNRLSLLARADSIFNRVADFTVLTWD